MKGAIAKINQISVNDKHNLANKQNNMFHYNICEYKMINFFILLMYLGYRQTGQTKTNKYYKIYNFVKNDAINFNILFTFPF